ncbi:hypothetical protein HYT45_02815 [Candidatus Uhrbacteria bacterium]|nr:hypothetical protein [Candidatus Uhrbacteria bacterium]
MTEDLENINAPKVEQAETREAREKAEDIFVPENIEKLSSRADAEVKELSVSGMEMAQEIAAEGGIEVDATTKQQLAEIASEATQAGDELKSELAEPGAETKEKAGVVRREMEYRDKEGNLIGTAIIELEEQVHPVNKQTKEGEPGKARILRSFVLKGEKAGKPTEIDILALAKARENGITVYVAEKTLKNYSYLDIGKSALVPPLENPVDIAVALHELGHADQHQDQRFEKISPLYGHPEQIEKLSFEKLRDLLRSTFKAVPEAKRLLDVAAIKTLREKQSALDRQDQEFIKNIYESRELRLERQEVFEESILSIVEKEGTLDDIEEKAYSLIGTDPNDTGIMAQKNSLIMRLEKMGFIFGSYDTQSGADEKHLDEKTEHEEENWTTFGEKAIESKPEPEAVLLPRNKLDDPLVLQYLIKAIKQRLRFDKTRFEASEKATESEISYHTGNKEYLVKLRVDLSTPEGGVLIDSLQSMTATIDGLERRIKGTGAVMKKLAKEREQIISAKLKDIVVLPQRMLERDATARAFQWMRKLRKDGIDLFKGVQTEEGKLLVFPKEETCENDVSMALAAGEKKTVMTDSRKELVAALGTYRATTKEMLKKYKRRVPRAAKK